MTSMAVFDTPPPPEGWHGRDVVRVVDPLGKAIAWIDPEFAGACIGFWAREAAIGAWLTVLESTPPEEIGNVGTLACEVTWSGATAPVAPARCAGTSWSFLSRDPTEVIVSGTIDTQEVRISSRCNDGALEIAVRSAHGADGGLQAGFRLHVRNAMLEHIPGAACTNSVVLRRSRFPFDALVCSASKHLVSQLTLLDDRTETARVDFVPSGQSVGEGRDSPLLAELTLIPAWASD